MTPKGSICNLVKIGPSILNSNLANLTQESKHLLECGADFLHLDVMDGSFVPNLTFGPGVVKCLRKDLGKEPFFDCHMMVSDPFKWVEPMADAGCTQYTYHFESVQEQRPIIRKIKEAGMRVGLAIKPATKVKDMWDFVESVDSVLIMTVEPGYGGQKFMPEMMEKVNLLRETFAVKDIGVDGGVGTSTVKKCAEAGANIIISGTAITQAPDTKAVIEEIKKLAFFNQK